MLRQLELNPHLKDFVLCLDHDAAGIEATRRLKDIPAEKGYAIISVRQSQYGSDAIYNYLKGLFDFIRFYSSNKIFN